VNSKSGSISAPPGCSHGTVPGTARASGQRMPDVSTANDPLLIKGLNAGTGNAFGTQTISTSAQLNSMH
jgi:hypothetical protein